MLVFVFTAGVAAALLLTIGVLRYALGNALLDVPNERSSHLQPTPRGGGLAIAIVVLAGVITLGAIGALTPRVAIGIAVGGALVASVGWVDDHRTVSAGVRLIVHLVAAAVLVIALGGFESLGAGTWDLRLGVLGSPIAIVSTVWLINLYNFMDGIDGIAGAVALVAGLVGAVVLWGAGSAALACVSLLLAASSAGFLVLNWAPARIFMGDVGSGFIGFSFAAIALVSESEGSVPALFWLLLLGVFVVDSTVTLLRRLLRRQQWMDAHRSHAYQRLVQSGFSHRRIAAGSALVTLLLGGAGVLGYLEPWVMPVAISAGLGLVALLYLYAERRFPMS
jgi:Fuc2NAc and GlcNAc transferase